MMPTRTRILYFFVTRIAKWPPGCQVTGKLLVTLVVKGSCSWIFVIILPNLLWQGANQFPSLELHRNFFTSKNIDKSWILVLAEQVALAVLIIARGLILAPVFLPLLPPPSLKTHISRFGLTFNIEEGKKGELIPQWLADRIGWHDLSAELARVYHNFPENEWENSV